MSGRGWDCEQAMSGSLFSPSWYRVAPLKPRLRQQAQLVRHVYRGERHYILQDQGSGRFLKLNPAAYQIVALMDGELTLDDIWQRACETLGDDAPTQDEVLNLMTQLHQANVLLTDQAPDLDELNERRHRLGRLKFKQYLMNPLSLKIPLFDPDPFISRLYALIPAWLMRWFLPLWLLVVGSGVVVSAMHWDELTSDLAARVFRPDNVLLLWLIFPVLKAIHEIGHGIAVKAFGGSSHETGVMMLLMIPVPYVDAGYAISLPSRWQRMLIGAAGMMIELLFAAVAIWLWTWTSPGLAKAALHQVVILAGVTTLLFNANPLVRFDGYYILSDWLEIPNLGQKANQYMSYVFKQHIFRVRSEQTPPSTTPRERRWLVFYAIGSFCYRILLSISIILLVAERFFFIGVLLAVWAAINMLILPLSKQIRFLLDDPVLQGVRVKVLSILGGLVFVLLLVVTLMPVPSWTMAEGVIWMSEQSRVRSPASCIGSRVLVPSGTMVKSGQSLLACDEPELAAILAETRAKIAEMDSKRHQVLLTDRVQAQIIDAEVGYHRNRLRDLQLRQDSLVIRSPLNGRFEVASTLDFAGAYVARGDVVGYVLDPSRYTLLTVVPQSDVDQVRRHTIGVEIRSAVNVSSLIPAIMVREVPGATRDLPSLALSLQGGGKIGLDPDASREQPMALNSLFQFELRFDNRAVPRTLGNRVYVRFVQEPEPLARQWYRALRQMFIKRFAV